MFDWLGDAWDGFTGLFGGQDSVVPETDPSFMGPPTEANISSDYGFSSNLPSLTKVDPNKDAPWYTNPNVLGSAITAGAGLFSNMSGLDARAEERKAAQEAQKMNSLLELAKLKHSILNKGTGSGGSRGGSGGAAKADDVRRQYSANKISQLSNLGANLANIYGG